MSFPKLGIKWFILVRVSNKTQLLLALKVLSETCDIKLTSTLWFFATLKILTVFVISTTLNDFSVPKVGIEWFILVCVRIKTQLLLA